MRGEQLNVLIDLREVVIVNLVSDLTKLANLARMALTLTIERARGKLRAQAVPDLRERLKLHRNIPLNCTLLLVLGCEFISLRWNEGDGLESWFIYYADSSINVIQVNMVSQVNCLNISIRVMESTVV